MIMKTCDVRVPRSTEGRWAVGPNSARPSRDGAVRRLPFVPAQGPARANSSSREVGGRAAQQGVGNVVRLPCGPSAQLRPAPPGARGCVPQSRSTAASPRTWGPGAELTAGRMPRRPLFFPLGHRVSSRLTVPSARAEAALSLAFWRHRGALANPSRSEGGRRRHCHPDPTGSRDQGHSPAPRHRAPAPCACAGRGRAPCPHWPPSFFAPLVPPEPTFLGASSALRTGARVR